MINNKSVLCLLLTVATIIISFSFCITAYANNESDTAKDDITTIEYFLFSDLVYEDLDDYEGEAISSFIEDDNVFYKSSKKTYKNSTGSIPVPMVMKKYIGEWYVDDIFVNDKSGFYGVAFKNERRNDIVLSFRGTTDAIGKDGINDAEFAIMTMNSPQMDDAFNLTSQYIKNNSSYHIGTTGHSLGGGLAIELSHYYHFNSETFNAAQITASLYYNNYTRFSKMYKGFDTWKHIDHVNEQDLIVGTFEYGSMKKAIKHKNLSSSNKFFAHAMQHMLTINSKSNTISMSKTLDKDFLQNVASIYKDINDYSSISLGSTKDNVLQSRKLFTNNDVFLCGDGNDYANAKGGNDVLIGGKGDDILDGGTDDDKYIYYLGDGLDTVIDPGGNDELIIYSDNAKVTYRDEQYYYIVSLNGNDAVKIDKASRLDGFCGKPYGNKENKSADKFTIKIIDNNNFTKSHKIKLDSQWHQVKKANISGDIYIDILDGNDNIVATLKNEVATITLKDLSAYVAYDAATDNYNYFIFSKDNSYYFNIRPIKSGKISMLLDTQLIDKTHIKYSGDNLKADTNDIFTLRRTNSAPILTKNNKPVYLDRLSYMEASKVKLSRRMIILENGKTHSPMSVKTEPVSTRQHQIYWSSDDVNVATVSEYGTITANNAGEAVVTVNVDGVSDSCRIYVLPKLYIKIIYIVLAILILLETLHLIKKFSRIIKKRKLKSQENSNKKELIGKD